MGRRRCSRNSKCSLVDGHNGACVRVEGHPRRWMKAEGGQWPAAWFPKLAQNDPELLEQLKKK